MILTYKKYIINHKDLIERVDVRMIKENKIKKTYIVAAGIALVLLILFLLNLLFSDQLKILKGAIYVVLLPASIALFISYLLTPLETRIRNVVKNKTVSVLLSILVLAIIVIAMFTLIGYLLAEQIAFVVQKIKDNWTFIEENLFKILPDSITGYLKNVIYNYNDIDISLVMSLVNRFGSVLGSFFSILVTIIMVPVFLFFLMYEKGKIFNSLLVVVPNKYKSHARELGVRIDQTVTKYFRGKMITILSLSLFFCVGFSIIFIIKGELSIPLAILYGLFFGLVLAFLDLVPYIGPTLGTILPMFFIAILCTNTKELILYPLLVLAVNFSGQWLQKILIEPIVMSKEVDLHPLLVFTSMLFFGALLGFVGFILATPICGIIKASAQYFRELKNPIPVNEPSVESK